MWDRYMIEIKINNWYSGESIEERGGCENTSYCHQESRLKWMEMTRRTSSQLRFSINHLSEIIIISKADD